MKFSVILPTYNRAHLINAPINSLIDQSYSDWELIVVDDASTDNTENVVKSYNDSRIKYLKLDQNSGNAAARNLGVANSSADWITFLDSDDVYFAEYLQVFKSAIDKHGENFFYFGGYDIIKEDKLKKRCLWSPTSNRRGSFLEDIKIGIGCGVVINKSFFLAVGMFDERIKVAVDTDFLIRLEMVYPFISIPISLIRIIEHNGPRVRKNTKGLVEAYNLIILKHKQIINSKPLLMYKWYFKLMWLNYHSNLIKEGNKCFCYLKSHNLLNFKCLALYCLFNILPVKWAISIHKGI